MRYFVLCSSIVPGIAAHIVAEVVRNGTASDDRSASLAGSFAGANAQILTRIELNSSAEGRTALEAWDGQDDAEFDRETDELERDSDDVQRPVLRLVPQRGI